MKIMKHKYEGASNRVLFHNSGCMKFVRKISSDCTIDMFVHANAYQLVIAKRLYYNFKNSIELEASRKTHGNACGIYSKVYSIPPELNVSIDQIYLHVFQ